MDETTAGIYEQVAAAWAHKRGAASDDRGQDFRRRVGQGLIADLGCGAGRYLGQLGDPSIGLDVSFSMLSQLGGVGARLVRGDLEALPFAEESLQGIFARHSYLHIPKSRMLHALGEAHRVLRLGGLLEMSLIGGNYEGRDLATDDFPGRFFALWEHDEIASRMHDAGFSDIAVVSIDVAQGNFDLLVTARS